MSDNAGDILVANDNSVLLIILSEIFKECGYSVRTAPDGLGALTEVRNHAPRILLSDLNMPRMSGFELLSIVRRRYPSVKVIAMSDSYSGQSVPHGVAAHAFYEKGATSAARLLQIVTALKDDPELPSSNTATPTIWIPKPLKSSGREASPSFACPECLRAYPHSINEGDHEHQLNCPYCLYCIHLAIVPVNGAMDNSPVIDFNI